MHDCNECGVPLDGMDSCDGVCSACYELNEGRSLKFNIVKMIKPIIRQMWYPKLNCFYWYVANRGILTWGSLATEERHLFELAYDKCEQLNEQRKVKHYEQSLSCAGQ